MQDEDITHQQKSNDRIVLEMEDCFLLEYHQILFPVINVIDPMVEFVIQNQNIHHVGIIATKTTIASGVYQEKLSRRKSDLIYSTLATPLLAPMIEEGFIHNSISQSVLHEYLGHQELQDIDSLVLACTHYPPTG